MKIDMTAPPAEETKPQVASTQAPAVYQSQAPVVYTGGGEAEGEFDASDLEKAKMVIVAKTGKLSNDFDPGSFLLNKEFVIGGTKSPLTVVPIAINKLYQNDLDFDGGETGDTVNSAVQVVERGGIVGYRPFGDTTSTHFWKKVLQIVFLVQKPDNVDPAAELLFPFDIEGKDYAAVGYWASSKTAYSGVATPLVQKKMKIDREGKGSIRDDIYRLSTKGESTPDGSRSWIQASLRATGPSSDAIRVFLAENFAG